MTRAPLTTSYWPADTSEPVLETTVGSVLREAAARAPAATALIYGHPDRARRRRWTFQALLADSERTAQALLRRFEPGDRVAVWAPNVPEWLLLEFGMALAGITLVTVNPAYKPQELEYVLRQSRAKGLFLVSEYRGRSMGQTLEAIRGNLPELGEVVLLEEWDSFLAGATTDRPLPIVRPDDPAQIQYTSGTTGFPKGAVLRHRGITNDARFCAERLGMGAADILINAMPLFHTAGCVLCTLGPLQRGSACVLTGFDPGLVLELIETERVTVGGGVPTMMIAKLEHPSLRSRDLSSLRLLLMGGATVPPELVKRLESQLPVKVIIGYGQTEASPFITQVGLDDSPEDRAHTLGRPYPQVEVKLMEPQTGATAAVGQIGELCTRGFHVMSGYFEQPEATAQAIDAEGWLHTGDLASMDERGFFRIEGRLKEMIIRGGENIYPREIEEVLFRHPAVAEAAVVGLPDETWGEQVAAFIRLAPGQTADEAQLFSYCREKLADYKTPRTWVFVDSFPLTASGKIQKFVLREQFVSGRRA